VSATFVQPDQEDQEDQFEHPILTMEITMDKPLISVLMALALLLPSHVFAETLTKNRFSDAELVEIMKNDGYSAVSRLKDGVITIRVDGVSYGLLNNRDGDLQTYYAISDANISYEDVNEWNRTMRLSRAYLDADKDPTLEADLLANGGLSQKNVTEFFKVFLGSVKRFREFVVKQSAD